MMQPHEKRPILAVLTSHWLSTLGSALVTIAGCSWLFLLPLQLSGRSTNPYAGILLFFAIPAVFFIGLILIPIGAWLARRRIREGLAIAPSRRAAIRGLVLFFGTMTVVNIVVGSQVTYRAVAQMETDQFCGQTCHVMKPQFVANQRTTHRNVGCVECHVTPGAAGFVQAKMNGTRQLMEVVLNSYPRPIPPGLASNHLASSAETCEQCHSRAVDSGSRLRVITKFRDDEANTSMQSVLMMNVGGGRAGGIHGAHMGPGIEIRYRTADAKRQAIPVVEYRNTEKGEAKIYSIAGAKTAGTREFLMQCADCHNRQGHSFEAPDEAVDSAIANGQILAALPFAQKTGVAILKANYAGEENAKTAIPAAFVAFYRQKYPEIAARESADVDRASRALLMLYQRNVFPDLGVKWGTYSNNLGHADNAGCFRCHDESHVTPQKQTITQDCGTCHQLLAVDENAPAVLKTLGMAQKLR